MAGRNVLAVVSDQKEGIPSVATNWFADYYDAKVVSANDYYPFGMQMPGRTHSSPSYRYGFNGKEKDESGEWGELTHYDYGFRIYNAGIGRFLSVDPLSREYPWYTPYQFAGNKPIVAIDVDGLEEYIIHSKWLSDFLSKNFIQVSSSDEIKAKIETWIREKRNFKTEEGRKFARQRFDYDGDLIEKTPDPDALTVYGFSEVESEYGNYYMLTRLYQHTNGEPIQAEDTPIGILQAIKIMKDKVKDKLGDDDSDITLEEAKPIMYGSAAFVGGLLSGGIIYAESGAASIWVWYAGGSAAIGFDDMLSKDGKSLVERTFITSEEAQEYYRGGKTIYAVIGGIKSAIDLTKVETYRKLAAGGDKAAAEAIKIIDGLNTKRGAIEGVINAVNDSGTSEENKEKN